MPASLVCCVIDTARNGRSWCPPHAVPQPLGQQPGTARWCVSTGGDRGGRPSGEKHPSAWGSHPLQEWVESRASERVGKEPTCVRQANRGAPMRPIFKPDRDRARSADCAPGPGVLVLFPPVARSLMCSAVMPSSLHFRATSWAASIAAYGLLSSRSAFTFMPPGRGKKSVSTRVHSTPPRNKQERRTSHAHEGLLAGQVSHVTGKVARHSRRVRAAPEACEQS